MEKTAITAFVFVFCLTACATRPPDRVPDAGQTQHFHEQWKKYAISKPSIAVEGQPTKKEGPRPEDKPLLSMVRWYSVHWLGMHIGDLFAEIKYDHGIYYLRTVTQARGLAWAVSRFKGDSLSLFGFSEGEYRPLMYSTSYQVRNRQRAIRLEYAPDGRLEKESNVPPENTLKRPPVSEALKHHTLNPLVIALAARQTIGDGKKEFTLPLYNGRSRSDIHFRIEGKTPEGRVEIALWQEPIAGHTNNELEDIRERKIVIRLFLAPDSLLPVHGKGESAVGSAILQFRRDCDSLDACMALSAD